MEALGKRTKVFIVIKSDQNPLEFSSVSDEAFDDCCGDNIWNGDPKEILTAKSISQIERVLYDCIDGDTDDFQEAWDAFENEIDANCQEINEIEKVIILNEFYGCGSLAEDSAYEFRDALGKEEEARKLIGDLYDDMNDAISNENIYQGSIAWIIDFTCKNIEKMADPYGSLEYDLFPERFDL